MGSPPGPVLGRTSIDDAAGGEFPVGTPKTAYTDSSLGSEEVLRRLSVNGDAGGGFQSSASNSGSSDPISVVARDPRPYLDKHPFRNMSLKQIKAYKGLTHTKNPNHNAKVIKTRMCTLLKLIAQLEATAIHHLVAHGWDLVAATVTHRANTKLLRDAFEVEYDVTNNARRNFLSGYLVPLPYIEKDISPPRQIRPPMRPSAINDESPEATKNRGDHPYQPSIALTATVNQTVSQTDGPSTAIVAQSMAAGPSSDPFSLTNRPNTLAYLAVYREVTRVATAKSLRMFLIHHKWDCNKAVLAYTQHPNCLERVKVAGMMGVNPSHLLLHIDDPSLAMYADHINGFATGLDRLGVKFNFDVALYCLRAASWNLKEALADYDRKEQMFAARCARIPEEAEPDFEDDGSDVEDALGVVRRHGEPTPEPTFDSDSESGSEEPSTNIYDRFDGTASEGSPCPEGGDTSEAPDFVCTPSPPLPSPTLSSPSLLQHLTPHSSSPAPPAGGSLPSPPGKQQQATSTTRSLPSSTTRKSATASSGGTSTRRWTSSTGPPWSPSSVSTSGAARCARRFPAPHCCATRPSRIWPRRRIT